MLVKSSNHYCFGALKNFQTLDASPCFSLKKAAAFYSTQSLWHWAGSSKYSTDLGVRRMPLDSNLSLSLFVLSSLPPPQWEILSAFKTFLASPIPTAPVQMSSKHPWLQMKWRGLRECIPVQFPLHCRLHHVDYHSVIGFLQTKNLWLLPCSARFALGDAGVDEDSWDRQQRMTIGYLDPRGRPMTNPIETGSPLRRPCLDLRKKKYSYPFYWSFWSDESYSSTWQCALQPMAPSQWLLHSLSADSCSFGAVYYSPH